MFQRGKNLVPISEALELDGRIRWNVSLPDYVQVDRIGRDAERLDRLALKGSFSSLTITSYDGETTQFKPGLNGLSSNGEATASARGTLKKADLSRASGAGSGTNKNYPETIGRVELNVPEIAEQVQRGGKFGALRNPVEWSDKLNRALADGVRSATRQNLYHEELFGDKYSIACTILGFETGTEITGLFSGNHFPVTSQAVLAAELGWSSFTQTVSDRKAEKLIGKDTTDRQFSIMPGVHYDRILAVEAITRVRPLIRPLKVK